MAPLEVHDPGLHDLIAPDAPIERVAGGLTFTEGPVWRGADLLFSDIPNKRIVRWRRLPEGPELTTYAPGMSNGLTLDRQGRVLAAEHDGRRVTPRRRRRHPHRARRALRGQAAQQPQRHRGQVRRLHLLHRPALRRPAQHAGRAAARELVDGAHPGKRAARPWRVPHRPRRQRCTCSWTTSRCRTASPSRPTSRCCTSTIPPTSTSARSPCARTAR